MDDVGLAAWTATQAAMGVMGALVWSDEPIYSQKLIREHLVRLLTGYFRS